MKRNDCFSDLCEDTVNSYIDEIENKINEAYEFLHDIKSVRDLHNVEECLSVLVDLQKIVY